MVKKLRAPLLTLLVLSIGPAGLGQTLVSPTSKPIAPGLIKLTGDDEKRAERLETQIDNALKADRWDEAIAIAEKLLDLRTRVQGQTHFETADALWRVKTLRRVARMAIVDRVALGSADALNAQGQALYTQGQFANAVQLHEKALEIRRRLLTDDHPDVAQSYNELAVNLDSEGKHALAQPLYEKSLKIHRHALSDDHPSTANVYSGMAYNLNAQGKYSQAQPIFEKALEIKRRLLTDDDPSTATSYNNLAYNLNSQGKYSQAQALYAKALEIQRRLLTDDHAETARSYNNLAQSLNAQGKYGQAQPLFEKSLEIRRHVLTDDHPETASSYNNVAYNRNLQGKYAEAEPLYEKALEVCHRVLTDDHPYTAITYSNLGLNLACQGKYVEAQPLYEKALEIKRRLLTDDHPETALSYNNLGANLNAQGKYAQAQPLLEKAMEIDRRLSGDGQVDTALSYNNLAYNLSAQGKYSQAQRVYEKALEVSRRQYTDDHPDTAIIYGSLAANLNSQGKYAQAQPLAEKALEIRRRLLTDDHPETAQSYDTVANNLSAQGKFAEAKGRWMSAVKSLDAARPFAAFTGLERAGSSWSARPALAAVLARLGQPSEAWQVLEDDLGRGLLDELAARQDRRLTAPERARLRELTGELEKLDKLVESTPKDLDKAERARQFEDLKSQRQLASITLGELHTKLVQAKGALAGQAAKLSEIQAALPSDAALIGWVDVHPPGPNAADPDGEHWGVVVRSRGIPVWVPIAGTRKDGLWTTDDAGLADRVRSELRARPGGGAADLMRLIDQLRAQRLAPLAKALGATADGLPQARRLIVLPSRSVAGIPIEALLAHDDTRTVTYAPSGTVFKYLREQPRPDRHAGLLALGDPVYAQSDNSIGPKPVPDHGLLINVVVRGSNAASHGLKDGDVLLAYNGHALRKKDDLNTITEGDKPIPIEIWRDAVSSNREVSPGKLGVVIDPRPAREAIAEQRKLQQVLAAARSGGEEFSALPGTRREVEAIAQLFRSDDRSTHALLGTDAGEPELDRIATSGELARFGFIHLATHGVIDESTPQRSAVILTQTGLPDPLEQVMNHKPVFDGRLSVREIQRSWDLKAELVTLSACETALGRESGGEGFVGFTQALLMSGARSVCLSLWKVDDKATSLLMARFYQNLLGKRSELAKAMPKAEALQEAKRWLRDLTSDQIDGELAALERGEVRPLAREKGAPARKEAPAQKANSVKPYDHPYYWAAFVLVGDPD
jgi:tetratricopeptide (TPR) repeat protein